MTDSCERYEAVLCPCKSPLFGEYRTSLDLLIILLLPLPLLQLQYFIFFPSPYPTPSPFTHLIDLEL
jgi:hypothetical protein